MNNAPDPDDYPGTASAYAEPPIPEPPAAPLLSGGYRFTGDRAALFGALAAASLEFAPIVKNKHVRVQTRDRGAYEFDYADLDSVLSATGPALARHGLRVWHFLCDGDNGEREIHHMLTHKSGVSLECRQAVRADGWQAFGSALTYARRYFVQCVLGVAAENDDDGNAADGNTVEQARDRKRREPPPMPPRQEQRAAEPPASEPPPPAGEVSDDTRSLLMEAFGKLGIARGPEWNALAREVTGQSLKALDDAGGRKLLAALQARIGGAS